MPAEAGDAEGYAVNTDPTSPRHGADADALLRATGRLETELKLQKSSLDEKQALLRELDTQKAASHKEYRKLTEEAVVLKAQLKAQLTNKRDHLVQHCEEHRTLQRKRLQCAKECASGQHTVSKLQSELEYTKQAHKKALREADRKKTAEADAKLKQKEEEKQKLAQDAKAALSAAEAEGALLQNAQVCCEEALRQRKEEDDVDDAAKQALEDALGSLSAEVRARLGDLFFGAKSLTTMGKQLKAEETRAKSGADNLRRSLERMEKNVDFGEADLTALIKLKDEIIKGFQKAIEVVPALVAVGNEQFRAQNAADSL